MMKMVMVMIRILLTYIIQVVAGRGERGPGEGGEIKGGGDIGPCTVLVRMVTLGRMMKMEVVMVIIRKLLIYIIQLSACCPEIKS